MNIRLFILLINQFVRFITRIHANQYHCIVNFMFLEDNYTIKRITPNKVFKAQVVSVKLFLIHPHWLDLSAEV